jgi:hypothetical protein
MAFKYEENGGSINSDHIFSHFEGISLIFTIGFKTPQPLFGEKRFIKSPPSTKGAGEIWFLCLRTIYRAPLKKPLSYCLLFLRNHR